MNDSAVNYIFEYIDNYLVEPSIDLSYDNFMHRSFSRWYAYELANIIMDNPCKDLNTLEIEIITRMFYFECISKNKETRNIFAIARETMSSIFEELRKEGIL